MQLPRNIYIYRSNSLQIPQIILTTHQEGGVGKSTTQPLLQDHKHALANKSWTHRRESISVCRAKNDKFYT